MSAFLRPNVQGPADPHPPATSIAALPETAPDLARLTELYDRALLLDRCAHALSRTAAGATRLAAMRQRLLLSMRQAGLPESRWFRLGRFGLYLEPRTDLASRGSSPAYRLHAAPWAAVRVAPALEPPEVTLERIRGAGSLLAALLSLSARRLVRTRGGRPS